MQLDVRLLDSRISQALKLSCGTCEVQLKSTVKLIIGLYQTPHLKMFF